MKFSPRAAAQEEGLPDSEIAEREQRVLDHFLTSKPEPHNLIGKKARTKRKPRAEPKKRKSAARVPAR